MNSTAPRGCAAWVGWKKKVNSKQHKLSIIKNTSRHGTTESGSVLDHVESELAVFSLLLAIEQHDDKVQKPVHRCRISHFNLKQPPTSWCGKATTNLSIYIPFFYCPRFEQWDMCVKCVDVACVISIWSLFFCCRVRCSLQQQTQHSTHDLLDFQS